VDVYELTVKDSKLEETVSTGGSSASSGPGRISAVNTSCQEPGPIAGRPIEKTCARQERTDQSLRFSIKMETGGREAVPEVLIEAVRSQLGLELIPAKRPVELVVLEVNRPLQISKRELTVSRT
jgi:hypothetical protein